MYFLRLLSAGTPGFPGFRLGEDGPINGSYLVPGE